MNEDYLIKKDEVFNVTTPVNDFITKSLSHKNPYIVHIKDKSLYIQPFVVSPKYSYAPQFFMKYWNINENDTVLDIGSGSGILAIFASDIAKKVVASDINPYAITCIKKSMELNNSIIDFRIGNLFEIVKPGEKFSKILFNAPYFNKKASNELELGLFDENYTVMKAFLSGAKKHLTRNGLVLLGFSKLGEVKTIESLIQENDYVIKEKFVETFGHTRILYYLRK